MTEIGEKRPLNIIPEGFQTHPVPRHSIILVVLCACSSYVSYSSASWCAWPDWVVSVPSGISFVHAAEVIDLAHKPVHLPRKVDEEVYPLYKTCDNVVGVGQHKSGNTWQNCVLHAPRALTGIHDDVCIYA